MTACRRVLQNPVARQRTLPDNQAMSWTFPFVLMLAGHFIADKLLQPRWFSRRKRSKNARTRWSYLCLHGALHGSMVAVATGSLTLTAAEALSHATIDRLRAKKWFGMVMDQALHLICKVAWLACMLIWQPR